MKLLPRHLGVARRFHARGVLHARSALAQADHDLLAPLVAWHIATHGNDPQKSLAALSSVQSAREELEKLADPDVRASLVHVNNGRCFA